MIGLVYLCKQPSSLGSFLPLKPVYTDLDKISLYIHLYVSFSRLGHVILFFYFISIHWSS